MVSARPPGSRPGGTPEEISRGQVRASGRRPRKSCRVVPCPSGASKKWSGMRADHWRIDVPEATSGGGDAAGWWPEKLLRCPAGAWPVWRGNRGPRPLARTCPRLISRGVPPGRRAKRRRPFSGGLMVASNTAKSSRRARIFPGARLCARSTSRSWLAPRDASDSNECSWGFPAAAAGPRRTQPRSARVAAPPPWVHRAPVILRERLD